MHRQLNRRLFNGVSRIRPQQIPIFFNSRPNISNYQKLCTNRRTPSPFVNNHFSTAIEASSRNRYLATWFGAIGIGTFGMIVLGGVTRLTKSGLSMVDWKLQGRKYPSTADEWDQEFAKYKQSPEFKKINSQFDIEEFKNIYFLEWFHRMYGRGLFFAFLLPSLPLLIPKMRQKILHTKPILNLPIKIFSLSALFGLQGLIGWFMVKSGLDEEKFITDKTSRFHNKEPRVSSYRLATHLSAAITLYTAFTWLSFTSLFPKKRSLNAVKKFGAANRWSKLILTSVGITMFSGAFVAGNDAGRAYNDWPMYAGKWIPDDVLFYINHLQDFDSWSSLRNLFFEDTAVVQFNHRNLAYLTTFGTLYLLNLRRRVVDKSIRSAIGLIGAAVAGQVMLGVSTLMLIVPVELGSAHQAGALTVWTSVLYLLHCIRYVH
eukprot:snap_masked-scaffold_29-processed-gene-1.42-mRNA-1 protein AED:0.05 eAED:0.05 QI:0/-1/0/1/-1/1/1/0/430